MKVNEIYCFSRSEEVRAMEGKEDDGFMLTHHGLDIVGQVSELIIIISIVCRNAMSVR